MDIDKIKEACKSNLWFLCTQMLGFADWDKVHDDIEVFLNRKSMRKLILVPRGHLKTSIITKAYSVQALLKNPNARILIANQVWDRARDMLFEIKQIFTDKSDLPKLFGNFVSGKWNQDDIVIAQRTKALSAPSIGTTGVEAEMTSSHYDLIIADDLMGLNNSQTKEQRDKVKRFYQSLIDLLEPGGQLIVVGTRWHQDDLYQDIIDKESNYFDVTVRSVIEDGKIIFPKKFNLCFDKALKSWIPSEVPTMDFIDYLKKSKGAEFYSQYMNNPIDEENQQFKKEYFQNYDRPPQRLNIAMTIDLAFSEKNNTDYTALVVCGMDENYKIYVLDVIRGRWLFSQSIENIFQLYDKWKPSAVALEVTGTQKPLKVVMEDEMRRKGVHFPITELAHSSNQSKEFRIKTLEPYYRGKMVYHAHWMTDLEGELLAFPKGKHDDMIDALASQLEILVPGDSQMPMDVPEGSWESAFREARKFNQPHQNFFHETVNGETPYRSPEGKTFWDRMNP